MKKAAPAGKGKQRTLLAAAQNSQPSQNGEMQGSEKIQAAQCIQAYISERSGFFR
jgi:hypothetical protein